MPPYVRDFLIAIRVALRDGRTADVLQSLDYLLAEQHLRSYAEREFYGQIDLLSASSGP